MCSVLSSHARARKPCGSISSACLTAKPGADLLRVGRAAQQRGGDPFESVAKKQADHPHKMKEDCDGKACHSGHSVQRTHPRITNPAVAGHFDRTLGVGVSIELKTMAAELRREHGRAK